MEKGRDNLTMTVTVKCYKEMREKIKKQRVLIKQQKWLIKFFAFTLIISDVCICIMLYNS